MGSSKELILYNARQLFAEKGFKGTTVALIAQLSHVTDAAIYRHYKSKQQIFDQIIEELITEYKGMLDEIKARQKSGYCLLETLIQDVVVFVNENETGYKVILTTYATIPSAKIAMKNMTDALKQTIVACLERGIKDGTVREDIEVDNTAEIITWLLAGLNRRRIFWPERDEITKPAVTFCLNSIKGF